MIFSELYSAYYNTVAKILSAVLSGETDEKALQRLVAENAFGESVLTILPALKSEKWKLMHKDFTTPLRHPPTVPLTDLQKQWLKAILSDPRIRLFDFHPEGLEDVEPLFTPADYYIYDRYSDGDPYEDEGYIQRFRFLLSAIREQATIKVDMTNRSGNRQFVVCIPIRLEYSEKDDKFRLITSGDRFVTTINLAKINYCKYYEGQRRVALHHRQPCYETLMLRLTDDRNALERCMLHFAHFEKQAEQLDGKHYQIRLKYHRDDVSELVIRVLSFGPMVEVTEPESFRELIKEKLKRQKNLGLK